jgi:hypothetical protein
MPPPYNDSMTLLDKLKSLLGLDGGSNERSNGNDAGVTVERDTRESPATGSEAAVKGTDDPVAADTDAAASTGSMVDAETDAETAAEPAEATADVAGDAESEVVIEEAEDGTVEPDDDVTHAATADEIDEAETEAERADESAGDETDADEDATTDADAAVDPTADEAEADGTDADADEAEETSDEAVDTDDDPEDVAEETDEAVDTDDGPDDVAEETDEADDDTSDADDASPSVDTLKGIGPAYADRLRSAGVETVADLAGADAEDLGAQIDVSPKRVGRWIDRANEQ